MPPRVTRSHLGDGLQFEQGTGLRSAVMDDRHSQESFPKLAIGILTRNHESYVCEALTSVAAQTTAPQLVVILDNGSTDGTFTAISSSVESLSLPTVRTIRSDVNLNASGGLRRLLQEARDSCDFLIVLHGDDMLDPQFVDYASQAVREVPNGTVLQAMLRPFGSSIQKTSRLPARWSGHQALDRIAVRFGNFGTMPGAVLPIEHTLDAGGLGIPEETCCTEDWILWQRLLLAGFRFRYIRGAFVDYRRHSGDSGHDSRRARALGLARALAVMESSSRITRCMALLGAALDDKDDDFAYREGIAASGTSQRDCRSIISVRQSSMARALARSTSLGLRLGQIVASRIPHPRLCSSPCSSDPFH